MIKKCVMLGLFLALNALLPTNKAYAEVRFDLETSKLQYSEFIWTKKSLGIQKNINLKLKKSITVYDEKLIISNKLLQNCNTEKDNIAQNFNIKRDQATDWEADYIKCNKDLIDAKQTPFYEAWYFHYLLGIFSGVYIAK